MTVKEIKQIIKRDGKVVPYDKSKITNAIYKAAKAVGGTDYNLAEKLASKVEEELKKELKEGELPHVEQIQDIVERVLIKEGHAKTAKAFIVYRVMHAKQREKKSHWKGSHAFPVHVVIDEKEINSYLESKYPKIARMFSEKNKVLKKIDIDFLKAYKQLFVLIKQSQEKKELLMHEENNYLNNNELAINAYNRKYFLKDIFGMPIEERPEDLFVRVASFVAAVEPTLELREEYAKKFYNDLFEGYYLPGGRVLAGAGDLYRLKTLANCFVTEISDDSIEAIYEAAYNCARTYSYGGGIGVDISVLRPKDAIVHNASDKSTGAVSFMELFSLTTGLIGQAGRRGALMITIDVKHPDVLEFIDVKKKSNWVTMQIVNQCRWSGLFDEKQLAEIERQVRENTQVRFANISIKMSDEFMQAVEEQINYENKILVYKQKKDDSNIQTMQTAENHYSFGIPSKDISNYELIKFFDSINDLNDFLKKFNVKLSEEELKNPVKRNVFGDFLIKTKKETLAIRFAGDFLLYFNQEQTGEIKKLVKARDIWDKFVESNYMTAEPGLLFWSTLTKYSPSNYVGCKIISTNPCGEVPLEHGGACNLGSINLSRFVLNPYTKDAEIDWRLLAEKTENLIRFLDNVVTWNEVLNPLAIQRTAAAKTRRIGLGVMGIADMLNQLNLGYDSDEGIKLIEEVMSFIANVAYQASARLSEEKGPSPIFNYNNYAEGAFFKEALTEDTKKLIKEKGLRNIALLSIAPTGTISNIVLSYKKGSTNYIGVSSGIEPIFSLFYTRRSESFGNKRFKVFHSTVKAFIDEFNLNEKIDNLESLDELKKILPAHFFRTAHFIDPKKRVQIQAICQKYIDQSISSTVNLPESIHPETISNIYLLAWKNGLKGITVYRDGSRYPILSVQKQLDEFKLFKEKKFKFIKGKEEFIIRGDQVIKVDSKLTTPFHIFTLKEKLPENCSLIELKKEVGLAISSVDTSNVCTLELVGGKIIKTCEE